MWVIQTTHNALTWYITWSAFVEFGENPSKALIIFGNDFDAMTPALNIMSAVLNFLDTLRLVVADSIMVSHLVIQQYSYLLT
jgi:hypothetical protein